MKAFQTLILLLLFVQSASAEPEGFDDYSLLTDLQGMPSSIVGGAINVITGHYFENENDLVTTGANPLTVSRFFSSGNAKGRGVLYDLWDLNLSGSVKIGKTNRHQYARVRDRGAEIPFKGKKDLLKVHPDIYKAGITNLADPFLSGKNNLKNKSVKILENGCLVETKGGELLDFSHHKSSGSYFLSSVRQANGCKFTYDYKVHKEDHDSKLRDQNKKVKIHRITSTSQVDQPLSGLQISHFNKNKKDQRKLIIESDQGHQATYILSKMHSKHRGHNDKQHRYCLTSLERSFAPPIHYEYKTIGDHSAEQLIKKVLPEGRFLGISYVNIGSHEGKAAALYAPLGLDGNPVPLQKITYSQKSAQVLDALGRKKTYHWSKDKRLKQIDEFRTDGSLYRSEKIVWDKANLKARFVEDAQGVPQLCTTYDYDAKGNPLSEHLAGNLSGHCCIPPKLGRYGTLIKNGCDVFTKKYTYTDNNHVKSETIGRQTTHYTYDPKTSLLKLKIVATPDGLQQRTYYAYNDCAVLTLEIIDDGTSSAIDDLSGVTERHIKRIEPNSIGLPHIVSEYDVDIATATEVLRARTVNTFSKAGLLTKQKAYDAHNVFAYSKEWRYDQYGNLIEETDAVGNKTTYRYDANRNCIYKQTPNGLHHTEYTYDFSNRLIKEEDIHLDGSFFSCSYTYDLKGKRTSATDLYGNTTYYQYDAFDRVTKKTPPSRHSEKVSYDVLNHPVKKTDRGGNVTSIVCNAYGKPCLIEHPDGAIERITYNLDGTIEETIDAAGTRTRFTYDALNRKIQEEKYNDRLLTTEHWVYNAFHLLNHIDPEGHLTSYTYDRAGRLQSEKKGDKLTSYVYDSLGRQTEKREYYTPDDYRATCLTFNLLGQVIRECIQDRDGTLFMKKEYAYDVDGNRTHETVFSQGGPSTTITYYNTFKQPLSISAADGNQTTINYRYDLGAPYSQTIDPKGNMVTMQCDTSNHVILEERNNLFGEALQRIATTYDPLGNPLQKNEDVLYDGQVLRTNTVAFEYDTRGRETAIIEAKGTPEQKITRREYDLLGKLSVLIKPDGAKLFHAYDPLGNLETLHSSDGTIDYAYIYDNNNNLLLVEDLVQNTATHRSYDPHGRVLFETQGNGISLAYAYDFMGRLTTLTLPDFSTIDYSYDAGYLREVHRKGQIHRTTYDLAGKRIDTELMHQCGSVHYRYDPCLRPLTIDTPVTHTQCVYDPCGNLLSDGQNHYTYDALQQLVSDNNTTYNLDSAGNRLSEAYSTNALNQPSSLQFDLNGNLRSKNGDTYRYDALDRMIEATTSAGTTTYTYDPFHRRMSKNDIKFFYQGDKEIGALSPNLSQLRIMGMGCKGDIGAAVLLELNGTTYVPLHDYRGNLTHLFSTVGRLIEHSTYSAYGVEQNGATLSPWGFSSKRVDYETGFSYFGGRYYDPETARWTTPDPLWFVDGSNRYSYVRNRPTQYIDPDGLFLEAICTIIINTIVACLETAASADYSNCRYEGNSYSFSVGLNTSTQFDHRSHACNNNKNGYNSSVYYTNCNGVLNSHQESQENNDYVGMFSGLPGTGIYNSTHGLWDFLECIVNILGFNTKPVTLLQHEWDEYFKNCPEGGIIIHYCHSQGAILTRNALRGYDETLRQRIHVIAVAPGAYIDENLCGSIVHLVSKNDIVPWCDLPGRIRNKHNIVLLDRHPDASYFDHAFQSPTYRQPVKERTDYIRNTYGDRR